MLSFSKLELKSSVLLFLVCLIISLPYFIYNPKQALMSVLVLLIVALVSRIAFFIVSVYSVLINAFFLHLVPTWGSHSLDSRIQAAFESPGYEQSEYFSTYFSFVDISLISIYFLLALIMAYLVVKRFYVKLTLRLLGLVVLIPVVGISLMVFPAVETLRNFQLAHLPLTVYSTYDRLKIINKRTAYLKGLVRTKRVCDNPYDKVIFIQGESVNKNHMSIYGYERKTTPFLDGIKPFVFNAIAATNQTRFSIPIELTRARVNDFEQYYQSESLVSTLSDCGYTTYWISNQGKKGEFDTTITSIANEADHSFFLNDLDYTTAGLDYSVIQKLQSIDTKAPKKQAFFIHLLGSHVSYSERYPADKALLKGDDVISHYDNSVYYTDYILSAINAKFQDNNNSLFVYLSDHGEVVHEAEYGHGYIPSYKEEFEVPFVIWTDEKAIVSKVFNHAQGKPINTESILNIMEHILGINDNLDISFSQKVISVIPDKVVDYSALQYYQDVK